MFGFGEERRTADAVRSRRKRSANVRAPESFSSEKSKNGFSKTNFSKIDLVGVGMGGAIRKFEPTMPDRIASSLYMRGQSLDGLPSPTESGVFVTSPRAIDVMALDVAAFQAAGVDTRAIEEVTLIVYGWENVQPGTLSWVFPSLRSALSAVRAMRNAVRWAVLHGAGDNAQDVDSARENGLVLVEAS